MAVPVLKLNLAPPPTLWRQQHQILGWACLIAGSVALVVVAAISFLAYREASRAGKEVVLSTEEAKDIIRKQLAIQERLRSVDVEKELPVWRLAERILSERSLPWSRLTAELERSMVQDVRLKSLQRIRNASQSVDLKIRGEAKSRSAEEALVTELQKNPFFSQVILEREADRQGGGVEFEYTLPISSTPPAFETLPKYGPARTMQTLPVQPISPKPTLQVPRPPAVPAVPIPRPAPLPKPPMPIPAPLPAPPIPIPAPLPEPPILIPAPQPAPPSANPAPLPAPPVVSPPSSDPSTQSNLRGPARSTPSLPGNLGLPSGLTRKEHP